MRDRSTEHSAETGQLLPAGQSSPEPASCRSLLLEISAGCPEEQQQSKSSVNTLTFMPGILIKSIDIPDILEIGNRYLGRCSLVGVFPGLESSYTQIRQLGLKDWHAPSSGGQQLEGGLQGRTQGRLGFHRLLKQSRQTLQQILHELEDTTSRFREQAIRRPLQRSKLKCNSQGLCTREANLLGKRFAWL